MKISRRERGRGLSFEGNSAFGFMQDVLLEDIHGPESVPEEDVVVRWLRFRADGPDLGEPMCLEDGGCACGFVVLVRVRLVGSRGGGRRGDFNARADREVTR